MSDTSNSPLHHVLVDLGQEEIVVLTRIARRLLDGQHRYGRLDIANDKRDFMKELREELDDALVYSAIAQVKAELDTPIPYRVNVPSPSDSARHIHQSMGEAPPVPTVELEDSRRPACKALRNDIDIGPTCSHCGTAGWSALLGYKHMGCSGTFEHRVDCFGLEANLWASQSRCTELLEENRRLKSQLSASDSSLKSRTRSL